MCEEDKRVKADGPVYFQLLAEFQHACIFGSTRVTRLLDVLAAKTLIVRAVVE
ncbi:hypothetical protein [Tateyamaria sp.]|uniref:hypothetical protein n=1 Tax=Tateyamaria sp. TaxID=1929288 RepID=UPI00329AAB2C